MNTTTIAWTDRTWNPMSGCQKVSAGCDHCYAERIAEPKRGGAAFPQGFDLTLRPHKLEEPFQLKQPCLIFVNSMSDMFWEQIPDSYRDRMMDVIERTPQHLYQVLTKRPAKMLHYARRRPLPPNFWAGVSVEDQRVIDRITILQRVPAEHRFLSIEPLIGPIELGGRLAGIHWAIIGGESGLNFRRMEIAWAEAAAAACDAQSVPVFVKQDSSFMAGRQGRFSGAMWARKWRPTP